MIDREAFAQLVRQALAHLHDRPYLGEHPLRSLLAAPGERPSAATLQCALLEAIEQLRPDPTVPPASAAWRRYWHLKLRYAEGATLDETARRSEVSLRQAHRDHLTALEALTALLWANRGRRDEGTPAAPAATATPDVGQSPLEEEVVRLAAQSAEGPVDLAETLDGALATVARMSADQGVSFAVAAPVADSPINLSRPVLRQILLSVAGYIVAVAPGSRVALSTIDDPPSLRVHFAVAAPPTRAHPPQPAAEAQALLDAGRRLIEMHGGVLQVEGDAGRVSVTLGLPTTPVATVLIVDDNPDIVRLFRRYLRGQGFRLAQATTGQQALRLVAELRPDVIVLDVLLPSQDGWEVLQRLRALPESRDVPTVICSVLPDRALALSLGATEFLAKPVSEEALRATLARCRQAPG